MSSPNPKNWQQRLQDLEAELNQSTPDAVHSRPGKGQGSQPAMLDDLVTRSNTWLQGLSTPAKVAVLAGLMVGGLVVVGMVLRLVQLAVQLAILAAIGYIGYRFILAPKSPKD
ncbi:MAG: hypothetical protein NZ772_08075 [Cyanobacteria bacterium]|nr:hypothetical protein [Cyanobacteriota bacterium]MDW8201440.1 hypothetical protein [Cyanobacteriota bacterium SKYGB_h_bin112]